MIGNAYHGGQESPPNELGFHSIPRSIAKPIWSINAMYPKLGFHGQTQAPQKIPIKWPQD